MSAQTVSDTLREIADWLDANPDLEAKSAYVYPKSAYVYLKARTRADLERIAAALGDDAIEVVDGGGYLSYRVHATQRDIGGREVRAAARYEYEPIIARVEP